MKIGILGCGWLGLPLAEALITADYSVKGTTTTQEKLSMLSEKGIEPFLIQLGEDSIQGDFSSFLEGLDVLIIAVPPGIRKNPNTNFVAKIEHVITAFEERIKRVIFISSTSVYGNHQEVVDENTIPEPDSNSGKQLYEIEELLSFNKYFSTCIVRFSGLINDQRHPVRFFAGKQNLPNKYHFVNLIHQVDCIGILMTIVQMEKFPFLLNAVYPVAISKSEYYQKQALKQGLPVPEFKSDLTTNTGKKINSINIQQLNYQFKVSIL